MYELQFMPFQPPKLVPSGINKRRWTDDNHLLFDSNFSNQSVTERWKQVVAHCSKNTAIITAQGKQSYQQVDRRAAHIAAAVLAANNTATNVVLLFKHGENPIVALIAAIKTGLVSVPLNPLLSEKQLKSIMSSSQAHVIITDDQQFELAKSISLSNQPIINIDDLPSTGSVNLPDVSADGERLSAILYTSGSSGVPKGVMLPNKYFMFWAWRCAYCYQYTFTDRIALLYEWSYVDGVGLALETLLNGSILCISDIARNDPSLIPEWAVQQKITMLPLTIPLMRYLAQESSVTTQTLGRHLEYISTTSMNLSWRDLQAFIIRFDCPNVLIEYAYGLTEASIVTDWVPSVANCEHETGQVFSGSQSVGIELFIVDATGRKLPPDHEGEIVVRGEYLALGYWRDPQETQARFRFDDDGKRTFLTGDVAILHTDGLVEIIGRKDSLVKVRGHRVELSAIEMALQGLEEVKQAVVIASPLANGDNALTAYVATIQRDPNVELFREALNIWLADHEIPSQFFFMDELPMNANGNKVDLKRLAKLVPSRSPLDCHFVYARSTVEQQLCDIWCAVLDMDAVGVHDSFLILGGNSIQAAQILSRVRDSIVDLSYIEFFDTMTIAAQAELIEQKLVEYSTDFGYEEFEL
jgi:acyl-CoA synthetase (AMP-forming)/AMP-acid ligase II